MVVKEPQAPLLANVLPLSVVKEEQRLFLVEHNLGPKNG
jgi:hypothetical protein